MRLELHRKWLTENSTISELLVNGSWECFVLEDRYRPPFEPKVPGQTAIPCGMYVVKRTLSPRFGMVMPLLQNVPGFEGVRIHPGNSKEDTEGCLLPGRTKGTDRVGESRIAYQQLDGKIQAAEARRELVTIEITIIGGGAWI